MGDYSDFYQERGENKRVHVAVVYKSGRKENHDYGTEPAANRAIDKFKKTGVVKSAKITGKKWKIYSENSW